MEDTSIDAFQDVISLSSSFGEKRKLCQETLT